MLNKLYIFLFRIAHSERIKKIIGSINEFFCKILKSKLFLIIVLLLIFFEIAFFVFDHKLSINISNSLPFRVFIIDKRKSSIDRIKNGDYIQFKNNNTHYYNGTNITKRVLAIGGNKLEIYQYKEPKNNIQAQIKFDGVVLEVRDYTKYGTKIYTNNIETIPQNYYFIYGTHRDSFDSRYREFGLINKKEIIGVAKPLF